MLEKRGVEPVTRCAGEVHMDDIEDEKRHEEMLQIMHGFVQRPHERDRQNSVRTTAESQAEAVLLNRHIDIQIEVHPHRIDQDATEADGKEFPHFPSFVPKPVKRDQYTHIHTRQRPKTERSFGMFLQAPHFGSINFLQRVLGAQKQFCDGGYQQDSQHVFVLEDFQRDIRLFNRFKAVEDES